jgi:hypothetical protein
MTKPKKATKPKPRSPTTRFRSAKTGLYTTRATAKRRPASTVKEKREKVIWRGWVLQRVPGKIWITPDGVPYLEAYKNDSGEQAPLRVKLVLV